MERHQEKVNVIWADGHVNSISLDRMVERVPAGLATSGAYRYLTIEDD